jgi:hypothetical protein
MMMDGRFDQHFAQHFAASIADADKKDEQPPMLPLAMVFLCGLVVFVCLAALA